MYTCLLSPEYSQSYNSYSYVFNNPMRFTDPSEFVVDWFTNVLTGDVYYNSEYKKGDEDKIEGEGWVHFAENGKLSETISGESVLGDLEILFKNQHLLEDINLPKISGSKNGSFTVEATLKGKKAEVFMNGQGCDLKPLTL